MEEKIALLLAKAESTDNPHEAEAYSRKAEELMLKFSINRAVVDAKRPGQIQDDIVMERFIVRSRFVRALLTFGGAIAPSFNLKSYQTYRGRKITDESWIWLVGHQSDVDQAAVLLNSLIIQAEHAETWWWKTEGRAASSYLSSNDQYYARRQFYFSFAHGVRARLAETMQRFKVDMAIGTDIVLVDRQKKVDDWAKNNLSTSNNRGLKTGGTAAAARAGHQAGREAVGQKAIR